MNLIALFEGISATLLQGKEVRCSGLCTDSRAAFPGAVFFCLQGASQNGAAYITQAIQNGAVAIVCETAPAIKLPPQVAVLLVPSVRKAMALAAANFYGHPDRKLTLIAVTGTNGKTTTTTAVHQMLLHAGIRAGLIGTIAVHDGTQLRSASVTTPEAPELHAIFARMVQNGCTHCVMEVSSQALAQQRVYGLSFETALFTNLTRDHLSFHHSFEAYYQAKRSLFFMSRTSLINVDNPYGRRLLVDLREADTEVRPYSLLEQSVLCPDSTTVDRTGCRFRLDHTDYFTPLVGQHNLYNAFGAVLIAQTLDLPTQAVQAALASLAVCGRCEELAAGKLPFRVFLDFAHSPDALEQALRTMRLFTDQRVLAVYGSGGDPEHEKRVAMGAVGCRLADVVYLTSDNPKSEDPQTILHEICAQLPDHVHAVVDRKEAILQALADAQPGDVVLLAGKGHETYQYTKNGKEPFSERAIVEAACVPSLSDAG